MNTRSSTVALKLPAPAPVSVVYLLPIPKLDEILLGTVVHRPTLSLMPCSISTNISASANISGSANNSEKSCSNNKNNVCDVLMLGRNETTGIHDPIVSRELAKLEFKPAQNRHHHINTCTLSLLLLKSHRSHNVYVNGIHVKSNIVKLKHSDEICLHKSKYKYKVHFVTNDDDDDNDDNDDDDSSNEVEEVTAISTTDTIQPNMNMTSSSSTSSQKPKQDFLSMTTKPKPKVDPVTSKIQTTARQHILHEMTCPICFEIMVDSHAVHPCGHVFCGDCIKQVVSNHDKSNTHNHSHDHTYNLNGLKMKNVCSSCPSCKGEIRNVTKVRFFDNVIWNMIFMGQVFHNHDNDIDNDVGGDGDGDGNNGIDFEMSDHQRHLDQIDLQEKQEDIKNFLQRSGKTIQDLSKDELTCIFGTNYSGQQQQHHHHHHQQQQQHHNDGGNMSNRKRRRHQQQNNHFNPLPLAMSIPPSPLFSSPLVYSRNHQGRVPAFDFDNTIQHRNRRWIARNAAAATSATSASDLGGTVDDPICL